MIFKVAHITFCVPSIEDITQDLTNAGYSQYFYVKDIINPRIKKNLMRSYTEFHDLALFSKNHNVSIELVQYPNENFLTQKNLNEKPDNLPTPIFFGRVSQNTFTIETSDIKQSLFFWRAIGFKLVKQQDLEIMMMFNSISSKEIFYLICREVPDYLLNQNKQLDGIRAWVLAFLCTSLESEIMRIKKSGLASVTDIEAFDINGKRLQIAFVQGYQGEIVELISV